MKDDEETVVTLLEELVESLETENSRLKRTSREQQCEIDAIKQQTIAVSNAQMAINNQLEEQNRTLRYENLELIYTIQDSTEDREADRKEAVALENKHSELMTQFAALDADYDQLRLENDANVENLSRAVEAYNELQNAAMEVLSREVLYKAKIAKLKYKALKAQIVKS